MFNGGSRLRTTITIHHSERRGDLDVKTCDKQLHDKGKQLFFATRVPGYRSAVMISLLDALAGLQHLDVLCQDL